MSMEATRRAGSDPAERATAEREITKAGPLLDGRGRLAEPGWARRLLLEYDREAVRAPAFRIKEWDYYCVGDGRRALALTVADNGYLGLVSATYLDLETPFQVTESLMSAFPLGRTELPPSSEAGVTELRIKDGSLRFEASGGERRLKVRWPGFGAKGDAMRGLERVGPAAGLLGGTGLEADLILRELPPRESMVIATPFPKAPRAFYYNQKINCQTAEGDCRVGGLRVAFDPKTDAAVLDWGRGVWTYANTWYWASASGQLPGGGGADARGGDDGAGEAFGFNLGCGFGDTSAATENMVFHQGRAHKIGRLDFELDHGDLMKPWRAVSEDGRLDLTMTPVIDRAAETDLGLIASIQHQVFGRWSGFAVLDDGRRFEIRDFPGFAEKVRNRW
ncbi:MAG: DUF2804 domain-containing protein [Spirochaetaceae bacterium]|nr:DUF2804 domain-containing protein [Spirochaetaceae bacterium]